eukprot:CAMPEP_0194145390 /NCGR_PEP_ID=MMETSP0152-20130528/17330_1 /TAXON_ID=1049557 /ORGANISM="Thalassiothrix antarctica, Strain L6-D1" /LENGTH=131 /DNA_ID=CAMNT_0038845619 /DNA_START=144 /DNA_END=539 /DNA_ORIENTATION=+
MKAIFLPDFETIVAVTDTIVDSSSSSSLSSSLDTNERHYGSPDGGCKADERSFQIQGIPGEICTPACVNGQCPDDVSDGVTATPVCALSLPNGEKYCALVCKPERFLRSSDDGCGDATCRPIQGVGICTFD